MLTDYIYIYIAPKVAPNGYVCVCVCVCVNDGNVLSMLSCWSHCHLLTACFTDYTNQTNDSHILDGGAQEFDEAPWKSRMREIQGSLILASLFEVLCGLTGLVGLLLKFIGPLTVAPIITLIGVSLFNVAAEYCAHNWWIAFM